VCLIVSDVRCKEKAGPAASRSNRRLREAKEHVEDRKHDVVKKRSPQRHQRRESGGGWFGDRLDGQGVGH
jgi:hypothetical protein